MLMNYACTTDMKFPFLGNFEVHCPTWGRRDLFSGKVTIMLHSSVPMGQKSSFIHPLVDRWASFYWDKGLFVSFEQIKQWLQNNWIHHWSPGLHCPLTEMIFYILIQKHIFMNKSPFSHNILFLSLGFNFIGILCLNKATVHQMAVQRMKIKE